MSSQHGLSCWWGWRRLGHKLVSYAETHPALPKIWERGWQMANIMSHPTSPLITARATKRSEANQSVTQLPPPLPAGKTQAPGLCQDGGHGKSQGERKQPPNCSLHRVCGRAQFYLRAQPQLWGTTPTVATVCLWDVGQQGCQQIHGGKGWPEGQVAPGGPGMGTTLLSHAGTWHLCTLEWRVFTGPTRLITMPPVGGTFPQIRTFCFFHMLPYGPVFLHKQSCTRAKKWQQSFTCVPVMSKPVITWVW